MAGKPLTQTESKAVAFAIDAITKNQMADMLLDLARRQIGIEDPSDETLLDTIQEWLEPIVRARGDGFIKLKRKYQHFIGASDITRARLG